MPNDLLRWVLTITVLAHGIGHVLFMPLLAPAMRLDANGHSWLLTGLLGDTATRWLASALGAVVLAAFAAAAAGIFTETAWWRTIAIVGAVLSAALVVAMWDGLPTSSAFFALAFDAVVLVALLVVRWPSTEALGS